MIAGSFEQIVAYFVFIAVTFIALTVAAVYVQRRRQSAAPPYLTPGYPITPAIFLSLVLVLLVLIGMNNPWGRHWQARPSSPSACRCSS